MEQTVVTQPKRLRPKKPRRRITPATVCQAIHDVPYIVARALIRAVRAVGHCFAWTWDAIASDVRANWRAFCCGRLVTGCRDALRSPALREVHHIMRDHPSIRAITMIAVTAVSFAAAVMAEPVRTMDAICIVVDGDGPHVLDERSEERTYDDLLLRAGAFTKVDIVVSCIAILLLLEAARRVAGMVVVSIGVVFLLYAFLGNLIPRNIFLFHAKFTFKRVVCTEWLSTEGILGSPIYVS